MKNLILVLVLAIGLMSFTTKINTKKESNVKATFDTCEVRTCIVVDGEVYCSEWKEVPCPDEEMETEQ